jgi:hypothetical protein
MAAIAVAVPPEDPHEGGTALSVPLYRLTVVTITLRVLNDDDLNDLFRE